VRTLYSSLSLCRCLPVCDPVRFPDSHRHMRFSSRSPARVVWQEGMYLTPHHFQAQRRHFEDTLATTMQALFPNSYGFSSILIDQDTLRNDVFILQEATGVFPDTTPFSIPASDQLPIPLLLAERVPRSIDSAVVHLALPAWFGDRPNIDGATDDAAAALNNTYGMSPANGDARRYAAVTREITDEVTGTDRVPVKFATKHLRLLLDSELDESIVSLPLARLRRDSTGRFIIDDTYVGPTLRIGASPYLIQLLQRTIAMLAAKGSALEASVAAAPSSGASGQPAARTGYSGNEVASRWMLHSIRSAEGPLQHLLFTQQAHPEQLWLELVRLAGALCTFSINTQSRDLPTYNHDDIGACFAAIERHLRAEFDIAISTRAVPISLARASEVFFVGQIVDPRAFEPGARWFLAIGSSAAPMQLAVGIPRLVKACAARFVRRLVEEAAPGLDLQHVIAPPPALSPRQDRTYFELTLAGPCGAQLPVTKEFGVYIPATIPDAAAELVILLPQ
jgi:type VI secretion system protein ImpJ